MGGDQGELAFFPDRVRIQPGQTVRWVVVSAGHSSTAYHPANHAGYQSRLPERAEPWSSDVLDRGKVFEHTFTVEGVYNYYCIPHEGAGMVGAIVVGRAVAAGPGTASVQAELPQAARAKLEELVAWAKGLAS